MLDAFLAAIGIKVAVIMAAFSGGLARIAIFGSGDAGPFTATLSVIGGTLTAVYVGPVAPIYFGWPESGRSTLAVTFLTGLFAMEICKRISVGISLWTPTIGKGPKNGS